MRPAARSIARLVAPHDSTRHPARRIAVHHHSRFLVVSDAGKPLGIMMRVDVFDAFAR
jgi:CBS domain-containing protein